MIAMYMYSDVKKEWFWMNFIDGELLYYSSAITIKEINMKDKK